MSNLKLYKQDINTIFYNFVQKAASGCWEWQGSVQQDGYGRLKIKGKMHKAYRLSYQLHKGSIDKGLLVCHICDNRKCVNPEHLYLGTHKDNAQDAVQRDRLSKGDKHWTRLYPERTLKNDKHGMAKLSWDDIDVIRRFVECSCRTYKDIALLFGVSSSTIGRISRHENWKSCETTSS